MVQFVRYVTYIVLAVSLFNFAYVAYWIYQLRPAATVPTAGTGGTDPGSHLHAEPAALRGGAERPRHRPEAGPQKPPYHVLCWDHRPKDPWARSFMRLTQLFATPTLWFGLPKHLRRPRHDFSELQMFPFIFSYAYPKWIRGHHIPRWSVLNHIFGLELLFSKAKLMELAREQGWDFVPAMWRVPLAAGDALGETVAVSKAKTHRGVHLVRTDELRTAPAEKGPGTLAQRFLSRPLLVDGAKFDMGVYALMLGGSLPDGRATLRTLVYEQISLRFCQEDYPGRGAVEPSTEELLAAPPGALFVSEHFRGFWNMPSLRPHTELGARAALQAVVGAERLAAAQRQIDAAIAKATAGSIERVQNATAGYPRGAAHFWELLRVDCFVGQDLSVGVVEINMSPNMWPHRPGEGEVQHDDWAWRQLLQDDTLREVVAWAEAGFRGPAEAAAAAERPPGPRWREVWRGEATAPVTHTAPAEAMLPETKAGGGLLESPLQGRVYE